MKGGRHGTQGWGPPPAAPQPHQEVLATLAPGCLGWDLHPLANGLPHAQRCRRIAHIVDTPFETDSCHGACR